jgi:predicted PurR-regulated permease PerM
MACEPYSDNVTTMQTEEDAAQDATPNITPVQGRVRDDVPIRTIVTTIGLVLGTIAALWFIDKTTRMITWVLLAGFFAVVLNPVVEWLIRRHLRRSLAITVVVLAFIGTLTLLTITFVRPLAKQGTQFSNDFPTYLQDAQDGTGRVGEIVKKYDLTDWVTKNLPTAREKVKEFFQPSRIFGSAVGALGTVFNVAAGVVTVIVLTILMLMEGHGLLLTLIRGFSPEHQERMRRVGQNSAKAITGYVNGNVLISIIAGISTWIVLALLDVPYAGVLALWVAFADLIPLVGATMGAIPAVAVAFLSSTGDGVAALIFYLVYQQFENQVLSIKIMSKTVALKPVVVLISVLFGVELFGLLGALLAIPVAGVLKVVGSEIVASRRPDLVARP